MPRLFVTADLSAGAPLTLPEDQGKYLARVMRLGMGDGARLFNGRDGEWTAEITALQGKHVTLTPTAQTRLQPEAPVTAPFLLFAPLKKSQTDFVVEKATELGAAAIWPVITARTQTRSVREDRLTKIALEAAEQTERLDLPQVAPAAALTDALEACSDRVLVFCDEAGHCPPMAEALAGLNNPSIAVLIGPEGGFSPEERDVLRARRHTVAVSLGPRILRAETAAIAALTLCQACCGDWRSND